MLVRYRVTHKYKVTQQHDFGIPSLFGRFSIVVGPFFNFYANDGGYLGVV